MTVTSGEGIGIIRIRGWTEESALWNSALNGLTSPRKNGNTLKGQAAYCIRRFVGISIFLSFVIFQFHAHSHAQSNLCITSAKANLRDQPNSSGSRVITQIQQGESVKIMGTVGDWTKVQRGTQSGYIWSESLGKCPSSNAYPASSQPESAATVWGGSQTTRPSATTEVKVLICKSAESYAYHRHECRGLAQCKHMIESVSLARAKEIGRKACGYCY